MQARLDVRERGEPDPFDEMALDLSAAAQLLREQAATIAHYKKMYERSSALAKIGVWECDLTTEELHWTDGVYDLFELPRGIAIDRATTLELYHPQSRHEMERLRAAAIRDGGSFSLDIRVRTALGNERWIRLTADVERENGRSVRIFGSKQDISEEKAARDKVQSLQTELIHVSRKSAMGAMVATLAHELNQPLAAIGNYVAGTRRALNSRADSRHLLEQGLDEIEKNAFRAGNIIRSLRQMSNGSEVRRQPVDPNALIHEAASLAMAGCGESAAVSFDLAAEVVLMADPVQIQQVLINLIKNACEAVQDSAIRAIGISTSVAGDTLTIAVEDSGPGIDPELSKTLFDSFVTTKAQGMGIGLSISRTIIEAHGGDIAATNREGGGASFRVRLPLTPII